MKVHWKWSVLVLLLIPSLAYPYKKVKCFVLKPPEQILSGVQRIAVLDFGTEGKSDIDERASAEKLAVEILTKVITKDKGEKEETIDYGRNFTNYLISDLILADRGVRDIKTGFMGMGKGREGQSMQEGAFTNVFNVVERSQLLKVLSEQELGASGVISDSQAVVLGNVLGVQAIVMGDLTYYHRDENYKETRTEKKKDKTTVTRKVNCERRGVNVSVRARIISTETGQVLGSTESSEKADKSACEDSYSKLPTVDEMITTAMQTLSTKIANYFAPRFELTTIELEKVKFDKFKNQGEKAAELAEELKVDEAYIIFKTIYDKDPYQPDVLYNMGILNEVVGNFTNAKSFYEMALQLKDEDDYKKAIKRTDKSVRFAEAMKQIGIEIKEHSFEITQEAVAKVFAKRVEIKGDRNERVNIYSSPDTRSDVVEKVPGSLIFTVIKKEGDFYLIQLLGDKQGYVHKDMVKIKD